MQLQPEPPDVDDYANGGDLFGQALNDLAGQVGEPLFGLMVAGTVMLSFYIAGDGDMATPSVLLILSAGLALPVLPGGMRQVAMTIMLLGLAGALFAVARRYFMTPQY